MDEKLIGVIVLMMCCICSSASSVMSMGGEEPKTPGDTTNAATPPPPPPQPDFYVGKQGHDRVMGDLKRTDGITLDECKALCKANDKCIGLSYRETDKICYEKGTTGGGSGGTGPLVKDYNQSPFQFYYKNVPGYEVKSGGDRIAGDIEGMPVTKSNVVECSQVCDSKTNCVGFSYNSWSGTCFAKKADGLYSDYRENGFQFYDKKA